MPCASLRGETPTREGEPVVQGSFGTVVLQKADLDTVCAGFLLGATDCLPVVLVADVAPRNRLDDISVLCLECGGAGEVLLGNFDHHDPSGPVGTAVEQAWATLGHPVAMQRLVAYVSQHDRGLTEEAPDPDLSLVGLFSAMRQVVRREDARFRAGLSLLRWYVATGLDPRGPLAARGPHELLAERRKGAVASNSPFPDTYDAGLTSAGRRLAVLTDGSGLSLRQLFSDGFEVVVAEAASFGEPARRRLTVALDPRYCHVRDAVGVTERIRRRLVDLEPGWGGPASGTILGSPRDRASEMALALAIQVCREEA